jgi:hypothetical protein
MTAACKQRELARYQLPESARSPRWLAGQVVIGD